MRSRPRSSPILRVGALGAVLGLAFAALGGCGETVLVGFNDALAEGGLPGGGAAVTLGGTLNLAGLGQAPMAGAGVAEGGAAEGGPAVCVKTACRGQYYQCGDCIDNDTDGAIDGLDPECVGPCDDDETGLSTGLAVSASGACRQDCYFDGDAGPGNDKCEWSHQCDPLSLAPDYPPSGEARCAYDAKSKSVDCAGLALSQPAACLESCLPLAPNGCDCFGCCELPSRSGEYHFIGKGRGSLGCQLDALNDPATCPPCTPVKSCFNDCAPCEICVGGGLDPSCQAAPACGADKVSCTPEHPCSEGDYCVTGCCVRAPVR